MAKFKTGIKKLDELACTLATNKIFELLREK